MSPVASSTATTVARSHVAPSSRYCSELSTEKVLGHVSASPTAMHTSVATTATHNTNVVCSDARGGASEWSCDTPTLR